MKQVLFIFVVVAFTIRLPGQTNVPVRLALVTESAETSAAADVLTAELSSHKNLQLLERNEIEKVYREQGLSAGNKDYLKLGQILGADGLLLFEVVRTRQATNLMARLIAVKPGVILTDGSFPWPLKDTIQWAESISTYLNLFLPKLSVLAKDAIPISVVNLRSAVASAEGAEAERQLKLLTIQRLSQDKDLFVLERQRMQLVSEEKVLKTDDSAFWNGSYLLEGVVDQNGYSKETITVNARLTPPKGGAPLLFEVSGSRTNLSEVINRLAAKVTELLKVNSNVSEWSAAEEAAKYFDEAKWALRWGVLPEAQAAADSAWALGKRDVDCAIVRVKAYEVPPDTGGYQHGEYTNPSDTNEVVQTAIEEAGPNHIWGLTLHEQNFGETKVVKYVSVGKFPDPKSIDFAIRALELYYEFSRTLPQDEPKAGSAWYYLGVEDLTVASQVLQHFQFVPESQKLAAEKLAELRALARSTAELISKSPTVHDSYFVGDRVVTHDELAQTIEEHPNIFRCKVNWGCFWQEKPDDCIAIYHELMSSPAFCYIHDDLWLRELQTPRLTAWNDEDRRRIPAVWNEFLQELDASTNTLLRLEAKAFPLADAADDKQLAVSFTNLFAAIFENHDALVANNVEVLYLDWGNGDLVSAKTGNGIVTDTKESLQQLYNSEYRPKLEAMDQEYGSKTVPDQKTLGAFETQKEFLKANQPYDFMEFVTVFQEKNVSKDQALEIQPLIAAYKSNLVAQAQTASGMQKAQLMGAVAQVGFLENDVSRVLNPPAPRPQPPVQPQPQKPAPVANAVVTPPISHVTPDIVTNIITVNQFFPIPLDRLYHLNDGEKISDAGATITAHHWFEEKLLLDFRYSVSIELRDGKGVWMDGRTVAGDAIGIFNPGTERWSIIDCPESDGTSHIMSQNNFYHRSVLLHGELFTCDEKQIKKYDFQNQQWNLLSISDGNNYELFAVNGHLYAASQNTIFEITNGGKETHILASTRRQPPLSALDTEDLGIPTLFEGPNHSLRVSTKSKVFTWTGDNWHENFSATPASFQPELIPYGLVIRNADSGWPDQISSLTYLAAETNTPELCLWQKISLGKNPPSPGYRPGEKSSPPPEPLWAMPLDVSLTHLPAALCESGLYLLMNHSETQEIVNDRHKLVQEKIVAEDGCNAALLCFSRSLLAPQKLFLKFDAPDGCPPSAGIDPNPHGGFPTLPPAWMLATTNILVLGLERPENSIPAFNQADRVGIGYKAGIWVISMARLDPAIAAQKQIQIAQNAQAEAQAKAAVEQAQKEKNQAQKDLLKKYDRNHNGVIDPEEKEDALDDPAFVESELDVIDANHNGWLDAEELAYFDANTNKILEPKEQAGIEIAQHLLAERLLKKFDANGDGFLDRQEFNELVQSGPHANARPMPGLLLQFPDDNHDGKIDLSELEGFLNQQLRSELRPRGAMSTAYYGQMMADPGKKVDARQSFKAYVELYWQNYSTGAGTSPAPAQKVLSDEEQQRVLQQLMQKRNAETPP